MEEETQNMEQFTLLEGDMEVVVEGKIFSLQSGESIIYPEEEHSLLAKVPCKMLQTSLK